MRAYYVTRDDNKIVDGISNKPKIKDQERLNEDHPDIVEYFARELPESTNEQVFNGMMTDKKFKAVVVSLNAAGAFSADGEVLSNADLKSLIKSNM